ncbi:MAG: hypothetical protein ACHQ49_01610 [Elusimicrobiota bacterium]
MGLIIAAAGIVFGGQGSDTAVNDDQVSGLNAQGYGPGAGDAAPANASMLAGLSPFVTLGGGMALAGLAASMLVPPTKYPASTFKGEPPPDLKMWGCAEPPSTTALKTMVA